MSRRGAQVELTECVWGLARRSCWRNLGTKCLPMEIMSSEIMTSEEVSGCW